MNKITPTIVLSKKEKDMVEDCLDREWEVYDLQVEERNDGLKRIIMDAVVENQGEEPL